MGGRHVRIRWPTSFGITGRLAPDYAIVKNCFIWEEVNNMWETIKDVALFLIALWGAIISTILAVREILKERRSLNIFLKFYQFHGAYMLSIVNTGHRPINIHSFNMEIKGIESKDFYTQVRTGQLLDSKP